MPRAANPASFKLKSQIPTEDYEQTVAVAWLRKNNIPFYHVPNGGRRSMAEGIKFKRLGVQPGVPDICITRARGAYHGLYIELKRQAGGVLSDNQKYWRDVLFSEGYFWAQANGAEECKQVVTKYLAMSPSIIHNQGR